MFCPHCGKETADEQAFCHACGGKLELPSSSAGGPEQIPGEMRRELGGFRGLALTMRESLFSPTAFFRKMPVSGGMADPALYAMITAMAGIILFTVWLAISGEFGGSGGATLMPVALITPFLVVGNLYLWAGMLHVLLTAMGGAKHGFEATFRVAAHSYGAWIFLAIPICGWPVAAVWAMTMAIIGLKEAQGATSGKAVFAVLFPILFCCAAAAVFILLLFGTIAASFGALIHHPWK